MNRRTALRAASYALVVAALLGAGSLLAGCGGGVVPAKAGQLTVLADTSFLADIAQNVAGDRLSVMPLMPMGVDPHSFEPTPRDATRVAESRAIIINNRGLDPMVDDLISGAGRSDLLVVEAAAGLAGARQDPHLWLDPLQVVTYVDNIRRGLSAIDPAGSEVYAKNAQAYGQKLRDLDQWISAQVQTIPAGRRMLVTNHESFGYFAKRYGFTIVGAIFESVSGEGSPSARELAALVKEIKATRAPAVFLETGNNPDLAVQIAKETGVKVVTDLYVHSLGPHAATYLDMMRWDVDLIVEALR